MRLTQWISTACILTFVLNTNFVQAAEWQIRCLGSLGGGSTNCGNKGDPVPDQIKTDSTKRVFTNLGVGENASEQEVRDAFGGLSDIALQDFLPSLSWPDWQWLLDMLPIDYVMGLLDRLDTAGLRNLFSKIAPSNWLPHVGEFSMNLWEKLVDALTPDALIELLKGLSVSELVDVLKGLSTDALAELINKLTPAQLQDLLKDIPPDDAIAIANRLDDEQKQKVLTALGAVPATADSNTVATVFASQDTSVQAQQLLQADPVDQAAMLAALTPAEQAALFAQLTPEQAAAVLANLPASQQAEVLNNLPVEQKAALLQAMEPAALAKLLTSLPPAERLALLQDLPPEELAAILSKLTPEQREALLQAMTPEQKIAFLAQFNPQDRATLFTSYTDPAFFAAIAALDPAALARVLPKLRQADLATVLTTVEPAELQKAFGLMPEDAKRSFLNGLSAENASLFTNTIGLKELLHLCKTCTADDWFTLLNKLQPEDLYTQLKAMPADAREQLWNTLRQDQQRVLSTKLTVQQIAELFTFKHAATSWFSWWYVYSAAAIMVLIIIVTIFKRKKSVRNAEQMVVPVVSAQPTEVVEGF